MRMTEDNLIRTIKNNNGFTLLEIMVSLVLIAIVVSSVIQLSSANLRNLASADDQIEAVVHANAKMREVLDLDKLENKSWNETDDDGYAYEIKVEDSLKERTDSLMVEMKEITLATKWLNGNKTKEILLKTAKMIPKSDNLKSSTDATKSNS